MLILFNHQTDPSRPPASPHIPFLQPQRFLVILVLKLSVCLVETSCFILSFIHSFALSFPFLAVVPVPFGFVLLPCVLSCCCLVSLLAVAICGAFCCPVLALALSFCYRLLYGFIWTLRGCFLLWQLILSLLSVAIPDRASGCFISLTRGIA